MLKAPAATTGPDFPIVDRRALLDPDATYLVTGGLGGFGLCLLPYLVRQGCPARDSRRGAASRSVLYFAAIQIEMAPAGFSIQSYAEPVDTLGEICAAISVNPDRRFTIYHCCDAQPPHDDFGPTDFGLTSEQVADAFAPYREFVASRKIA